MNGTQFIDYLIPFISQMSIGPVIIVLSIIFIKFPPKEINNIYGYRTKNSMKSQNLWDYANNTFAKNFLYIGIITTVLQFIITMLYDHILGIFAGLTTMAVLLFVLIVIIEKNLKNMSN